MVELFRECLFNLGIMSTSSLIQFHQDHQFYFHGLFGLYDPLGLHQCLKAQLITAFIQDIFKFIRSTIFGYSIYLTIAFLDLFLYPSRGIFSISLLLPFFSYVKKHSLAFLFSMGTYITSQVTRGSSAQCQTSEQPTRMIQAYYPTYQRQFLSPTQS